MKMQVNIQRICVKAKPSKDNKQYYEWQTASICMFIPENNKHIALQKAREELKKRHWEFIEYENKSTLIKERVRELGGEVWEAYKYAEKGKNFFRVFPDHFGGDKQFCPIMPPRITEAFMDVVMNDAGGRRLTDQEKNYERNRNADYILGKYIFELKDLQEEGLENKNRQKKLAQLFLPYSKGNGVIAIDSSVLSKDDHLKYLDIMSGSIKSQIKSASQQIKSTRKILKNHALKGGIIFLNTGFGSFSHEQFENQVNRYAQKDSRQFDVIICISNWLVTNGFESIFYYSFSPADPQEEEVKTVKKVFESQYMKMMTNLIRGTVPASQKKADPLKPVTFMHNGVDFNWKPPTLPKTWE